MLYIDCKKSGPPEVLFLNEQPEPEPLENEVLVQVKAAGVNRPDLLQRAGLYPPPRNANPILGLEVAGIVAKTGPHVKKWKEGDHICALTNGGGYAEYCSVPEKQCLPLPEGLNFIEAASLPETYFTVWGNLFMRAHLKGGESVLVHGGSGGIGSSAIQLCKAFDAHVTTTVSSAKKAAFCTHLKADRVINYRQSDFFSQIEQQGVDLILDVIGGDYFEKNLRLLKEEGRLVQIACLRGSSVTLDLNLLYVKRLTILGSTLRAQSSDAKAKIAAELLKHVWPLFEKRQLQSVVTATFPLAQASKAHELMESREHCGKIVLTI